METSTLFSILWSSAGSEAVAASEAASASIEADLEDADEGSSSSFGKLWQDLEKSFDQC